MTDINVNQNGEYVVNTDEDTITLTTEDTYVDKNIVFNINNTSKANNANPAFTGTATLNGEEIATKRDINESDLKGEKGDTPTITAETENLVDADGTPGVRTSFYVDGEDLTEFTLMDGHKGERGISLLHVQTSPWANTH